MSVLGDALRARPDWPVLAAQVTNTLGPLRLPARPAWFDPSPKQELFLRTRHLEVLFGGAAGPGKSTALVAAAVQFIDVPGYNALLLRRTYRDLKRPGALIPMSFDWLRDTPARWSAGDLAWLWPGGGSLTFGHMQHEDDKLNYQGAAYHFVGFDELTQFSQTQYEYLFSRIRGERPEAARDKYAASAIDGMHLADVPYRMRSATNPGGPGHTWVKLGLVDRETRRREAIFVPSKAGENPALDQEAYARSLERLGPVERARLLAGDWTATEDGGVLRSSWFGVVADEAALPPAVMSVRAWDLAATEPGESNPDPDWTVGVRIDRLADGTLLVSDVQRFRGSPLTVERALRRVAEADGTSVTIKLEQEPGSAGKGWIDSIARGALLGWAVTSERPTRDKVTRAQPVASAAERGAIRVLGRGWTFDFLEELNAFPVGHDDQVDALSAAFEMVAHGPSSVAVPTGQIPIGRA